MIIRPLETIDEYAACEQLMQDCWQTGPSEAVPAHLLITIQHESGVVLGAFTPEGRLVGFAMGFLARDGDGLKHHSHMAGVHPDFRDRNVAYRLKMAQRDWALGQGLAVMTWTYDPLEARNATLNIAKLGAVARTYKRNIYGQGLGPLNAALPTDRFQVRWELDGPRATACAATGQRVAAPAAELLLSAVDLSDDGLPRLIDAEPVPPGAEVVGFHIPARMQDLKRTDPEAALAWRMGTRAFFEAAFRGGFTVVNVTPDRQHPYHLVVYSLARA